MKQNEFSNCVLCDAGMAKDGVFFYRVSVEQMVLDLRAIQKQHGMEMIMGAAAPLAKIMGPNEDLARGLGPTSFLVCGKCALHSDRPIAAYLEAAHDKVTKKEKP